MSKNLFKRANAIFLALIFILSIGKVEASTSKYVLNNNVKIYSSAYDAKNRTSPVGTYYAGNYYVYKYYDGMVNISKSTTAAGAWINPADNKTVTVTLSNYTATSSVYVRSGKGSTYAKLGILKEGSQVKGVKDGDWLKFTYNGRTAYSAFRYFKPTSTLTQTTPNIDGDMYTATSSVYVRSGKGSTYPKLGVVQAGTRVEGVAEGAWLKFIYNGKIGYSALAYYKKDQVAVNDTLSNTQPYKALSSVYVRDARTLEKVGIIKEASIVDGVVDGAWLKIIYNGKFSYTALKYYQNLNEQVDPIVVEQPPTVSPTNPPSAYVLGQELTIKNIMPVYTNSVEASQNAPTSISYNPGQYFVYKIYEDVLNITRVKGQAGAWINPLINGDEAKALEILGHTKTESVRIESPIASGSSYAVFNNISKFISATDAQYTLNPQGTFGPGNYYIFETYGNMLNISSVKGQKGMWINPAKNDLSQRVKPLENPVTYLQRIGESARILAGSNDLYASVMIAQSMLETGYGTSVISSPMYNNIFGIKGRYNGDAIVIKTTEYTSTTKYEVLAEFKKYPNIQSCMQDYVFMLTGGNDPTNWRYNFYIGVRKSKTKSYKDATAYLTGRYATSPTYGTVLNELIERYNLTQFDTVK